MLVRKAYEQFTAWKDSPSRTALLVTGARQVGKTYSIREFARNAYEQVIELNLIESPQFVDLFKHANSARDILVRLSLATEKQPIPGKTLIFIDEVQECPEIVTAIKFLVDEGSYEYALSGSLLGVELADIRSVPVGYLSTIKMYPLDFEEYCWAQGIGREVFDLIRDCFASSTEVDDFVHRRLLDEFNRYLIIGGMPDAVTTFQTSNNLANVRAVQDNIKLLYRNDISKYVEKSQQLAIKEIYDLIPSELNNPNKRFIFNNLGGSTRFRAYQNQFSWLIEADVALAVHNVDEPCRPLLLSKQRNLFKLFYSDIGLLTSSFLRQTSLDILAGKVDINYGSIYENVVAQELRAHGFDLYYYNNKRRGEVDFVIEDRNGTVMPIEVKSGKAYQRHRALNNILMVENYHLNRGYVLSSDNLKQKGKVRYLPVYMVGLFVNT
jgi:predicted AAA+ superfamily ATPase